MKTMTMMSGMIWMTASAGTNPELFHTIYWTVIVIVCFIGFKLFKETE